MYLKEKYNKKAFSCPVFLTEQNCHQNFLEIIKEMIEKALQQMLLR